MTSFSFNEIRASRRATTLTEDQLRRAAPSIFAETSHDSRSHRYAYIPTKAVIEGLARENFLPVAARQSRTRDATRTDYTKHMICFRRPGDGQNIVGDTIPELVLINSHDGTSSYQLMAGLFRLVCLNGMVVSDGTIVAVHIPHKGDVIGQVIEGAYTVLNQSTKAIEAMSEWSQLQLTPPERHAFADAAHGLRFADAEGNVSTPILPAQLLQTRRPDDRGNDLWNTLNVVQENVIRGGLTGWARDINNRRRRSTSREVKGIDQDVKLNRALWNLAEKMAEIKLAA